MDGRGGFTEVSVTQPKFNKTRPIPTQIHPAVGAGSPRFQSPNPDLTKPAPIFMIVDGVGAGLERLSVGILDFGGTRPYSS